MQTPSYKRILVKLKIYFFFFINNKKLKNINHFKGDPILIQNYTLFSSYLSRNSYSLFNIVLELFRVYINKDLKYILTRIDRTYLDLKVHLQFRKVKKKKKIIF